LNIHDEIYIPKLNIFKNITENYFYEVRFTKRLWSGWPRYF
jgi:hypothetical protein